MIIESFGIFCTITFTVCINYNYYHLFKNDYENIDPISKDNIIRGVSYNYNIHDKPDLLFNKFLYDESIESKQSTESDSSYELIN
jgi:hypothetical protein